ncbi:hypothetical protein MW887_000890 [Aspergillus wentii]|nr:hypothetical protein MW887_000890 [Aspergillus wentii]
MVTSTPQVPNRFQEVESDSLEETLSSDILSEINEVDARRSISPIRTIRTVRGSERFDDGDVSTITARSQHGEYDEVDDADDEHTERIHSVDSPVSAPSEHDDRRYEQDDATQTENLDIEGSPPKTEDKPPTWQPYTFRNFFIVPFSILPLGLCLTTLLLFWRSQTNYGLGNDDGSTGLLFGWRFSPTLIAVIYIQLSAMLFQDIKRTEPYARMAQPDGATASASVLQTSGAWWNTLHDGFSKKKNGSKRRSWALICATLINIFGFLAISPLSSAFLTSEDVEVRRSVEFTRLEPLANSQMAVEADRTTTFRTFAHLLKNVSTSPWITDEYTMLPFWPSDSTSEPLNVLPSDLTQTWKVDTTVFKSELICNAMTFEGMGTQSSTFGMGESADPATAVAWNSSNGCSYGLQMANTTHFVRSGGSSWRGASDNAFLGSLDSSYHTPQCEGHEIIILTDAWNSTAYKDAQLCKNSYSMANVTASVKLTDSTPQVSFDQDEYIRNRVPIPDALFNTTHLQDLALTTDWSSYMASLLWEENRPVFDGLSLLLGAMYDYNSTALVSDPDVVSNAAKVKQRLLGEILQSALANQDGQRTPTKGRIYSVERRVVVVAGPAIALGILFFISFCLVLVVWWSSRLQRRPLKLSHDPATVLTMGSLVAHDRDVRASFDGLDQSSNKELETALKQRHYYTEPDRLFERNANRLNPENTETVSRNLTTNPKQKINNTPLILRLPLLLTLIICLIAVVVGIAVLYHYARDSNLYHKAFVYQASVTIFHKSLPTVAPFSMIPTIIAVGIGLWWSALDDSFRRLQPFIAMAKGRPSLSEGVGLSYQSSYWIWGPAKAAMNTHWLLFLVTSGTALSPIFTTAMSGLFQRNAGDITQSITLPRDIEIRQIPYMFTATQSSDFRNIGEYSLQVMREVGRNLSANYMFTAPLQLVLNSSEPPWSKDGWSFVPLDLATASNESSLPVSGSWEQGASTAKEVGINFTFSTPAIRGRIECSPLDGLQNLSSWLTTWDLTNKAFWRNETNMTTGYELGTRWADNDNPSLILPEQAESDLDNCPGCTTMLSSPKQVLCCGNGSSLAETGNVAFGYWSANSNPNESNWTPQDWQHNFTTKWITGNATPNLQSELTKSGNDHHLIFGDIPSISALNCQPIVETANATVTVNPNTGEIRHFDITSTPEIASSAFSDNFVIHNDSHLNSARNYEYNITLSYGNLFMSVILITAETSNVTGTSRMSGWGVENLLENTYNFRDNSTGLNMDYMTYSMFSMANKSPDALLNSQTLDELSKKTFTTFFQHFVSNDISPKIGGWAYQPINASLPSDLAPAVDDIMGGKATAYQDDLHPILHTKRTVSAVVSQRVELLHMNPAAVWLSIAILGWMMITTVIVAILQRQYLGNMLRNVGCLADVLVLVAGSDNLMRVMEAVRSGKFSASDYENIHTRLGWFIGGDGKTRWGIEVEERFMDGPQVTWVSPKDTMTEKGGNNVQVQAVDG